MDDNNLNSDKLTFEDKTVIIKKIYPVEIDPQSHWLDQKFYWLGETEPFYITSEEDHSKLSYLINLKNALPIELVYGPFKNNYYGHEKISDIVTKTWILKFEIPFKFYYGNALHLFGHVYNSNIYFDFKPNEVQWRKWKKQTVEYDSYSHYFIYIERDWMFSNGGYGSHMDIKANFMIDPETNLEYAEIKEIQFYDVKDPDNTIKIGQIRCDIFKYEMEQLKK